MLIISLTYIYICIIIRYKIGASKGESYVFQTSVKFAALAFAAPGQQSHESEKSFQPMVQTIFFTTLRKCLTFKCL